MADGHDHSWSATDVEKNMDWRTKRNECLTTGLCFLHLQQRPRSNLGSAPRDLMVAEQERSAANNRSGKRKKGKMKAKNETGNGIHQE